MTGKPVARSAGSGASAQPQEQGWLFGYSLLESLEFCRRAPQGSGLAPQRDRLAPQGRV